MKILGLDVGGTSIKIGLIDNKKIIQRWTVPTNLDNLWVDVKKALIDLNWKDIAAIGVAIPGFIDHKNSVVILSGNMNLKNYDVKKEFKKVFKKDAFVINDANAAALGEHWAGPGWEQNVRNSIFYTLGTGIGGGIIIDNKLFYGKDGFAGEFGHGGLMQNVKKCSCGLANCIEATSSAINIQQKLQQKFNKEILLKDLTVDMMNGNNKEVFDVLVEALTPLASHIAIMQTALNPELIIIGGGPSNLGEPFRKLLSSIVSKYQLDFITRSSSIVLAQTKNDAGILGAAKWALDNI